MRSGILGVVWVGGGRAWPEITGCSQGGAGAWGRTANCSLHVPVTGTDSTGNLRTRYQHPLQECVGVDHSSAPSSGPALSLPHDPSPPSHLQMLLPPYLQPHHMHPAEHVLPSRVLGQAPWRPHPLVLSNSPDRGWDVHRPGVPGQQGQGPAVAKHKPALRPQGLLGSQVWLLVCADPTTWCPLKLPACYTRQRFHAKGQWDLSHAKWPRLPPISVVWDPILPIPVLECIFFFSSCDISAHDYHILHTSTLAINSKE